MSVRKLNKNHKPNNYLNPKQSNINSIQIQIPESQSELFFWLSSSNENFYVDLTSLSEGQDIYKGGKRGSPIKGRPLLISQLLPAFKEHATGKTKGTLNNCTKFLRWWWRLFQEIERNDSSFSVECISDINEVHYRAAADADVQRQCLEYFRHIVNVTRKSSGLPSLYWPSPSEKANFTHIPEQPSIDNLRHLIRRYYYREYDKFRRRAQLLRYKKPIGVYEEKILREYQHFKEVQKKFKTTYPDSNQIRDSIYHGKGVSFFSIQDMRSGFFPETYSIRAYFFQMLSGTGWNPSTVLAIPPNREILIPHPIDSSRYILYSYKSRSDSTQFVEGLFKSTSSPGRVFLEVLNRTRPLRRVAKEELTALKILYQSIPRQDLSKNTTITTYKRIIFLEKCLNSLWIFSTRNNGISYLNFDNFNVYESKGTKYLKEIANIENRKSDNLKKIPLITPSDLRDAYATYAYKQSGGSILSVSRALQHTNILSTKRYLNNNIIRSHNESAFIKVVDNLWQECVEHQRIDVTFIAANTKFGEISNAERVRIQDYRNLRKSRLGIGCIAPNSPPKHIDPKFSSDKKKFCSVQRCILCHENAVIFPESIDGICMRTAELLDIQNNIPSKHFIQSSFYEELENCKAALLLFDAKTVQNKLKNWTEKISLGLHKTIDFDGEI